jgi:hypothetical protein
MTKTELEKLTTQNIIDAIRFAGDLFDSIAADTYHYMTSMKNAQPGHSIDLSRKQYYKRVAKLRKLGLIKRQNRRYVLTNFGIVIYDVQLKFREALDSHLKSKNTM